MYFKRCCYHRLPISSIQWLSSRQGFGTTKIHQLKLSRSHSPNRTVPLATFSSSPPDPIQDPAVKKKEGILLPDTQKYLKIAGELSKSRLATLVVLTTMCGYALAPASASLSTLLFTTIGTSCCVASANAFNQWIEVPFDAQMSRTRNRILLRGLATPLQAFAFASLTGVTGTIMLATQVNAPTAVLGLLNIALYAAVYTPMKRISVSNTWLGAIVGAIPPVMGWTACSGSILEPGAWILGWSLYAWQFPHFNAFSWTHRVDYARAGYQMLSVFNPRKNALVALRYSLALLPVSLLTPLTGITTWWFALDSLPLNVYLCWRSWEFYKSHRNLAPLSVQDREAKKLFFSTLVYLPVLFALMLLHKRPSSSSQEEEESIATE